MGNIFKTMEQILNDIWDNLSNSISVKLTGSGVPNSQQIPTKIISSNGNEATVTAGGKLSVEANVTANVAPQTYKSVVNEALQGVINSIGQSRVMCMLPLWETSSPFSCLVHPENRFDLVTDAFNRSEGPFGHFVTLTSGHLLQRPVMEQTEGASTVRLDAPNKRLAVRMPLGTTAASVTSDIGYILAYLQRVGSAASATLRAYLCSDTAGQPGPRLGAMYWDMRNKDVNFDTIPTTAGWFGVPLQAAQNRTAFSEQVWVVIEYVNGTGVDVNNYIQWFHKTTQGTWGAGDAQAVWSGSAWTVTANQPFQIKLFSEKLVLPADDWSIAVAIRNTNTAHSQVFSMPSHLNTDAIGLEKPPTGGLRVFYRTEHLATGINLLTQQSLPVLDVYESQWNFVVMTFSKAKNVGKLKVYINGEMRLREDQRSTGGSVTPYIPYPWMLGGYTLANSNKARQWQGNIGPFMIFNKELTPEEANIVFSHMNKIKVFTG